MASNVRQIRLANKVCEVLQRGFEGDSGPLEQDWWVQLEIAWRAWKRDRDSKWVDRTCASCGKTFPFRRCWERRSREAGKFCGLKCRGLAFRKHKVKTYKGLNYFLDKNRGYYLGHGRRLCRVVFESEVGPIPPGYVVHHKNHNPSDDRIENLEIMPRSEHNRHHAKARKSDGS